MIDPVRMDMVDTNIFIYTLRDELYTEDQRKPKGEVKMLPGNGEITLNWLKNY